MSRSGLYPLKQTDQVPPTLVESHSNLEFIESRISGKVIYRTKKCDSNWKKSLSCGKSFESFFPMRMQTFRSWKAPLASVLVVAFGRHPVAPICLECKHGSLCRCNCSCAQGEVREYLGDSNACCRLAQMLPVPIGRHQRCADLYVLHSPTQSLRYVSIAKPSF